MQQFDNKFYDINPDDKVAIARTAAEEVLGKDDRIISVGTSYSDGESASYRLASNGFEGESQSTWFSVSAEVAMRGEGEARPSSFWYDSSLYFDKLIKSGITIGGNGARYFDNEGVATERRPIFENGILKTYFIDTYNSKKMGVVPTINSPSLLVLQPGSKDVNGLVADVQKGILITGFNGGNSNSSTGDFSYGIEGFLIENGKLTQPISEMNITGNMITLWSSLAAVGNDPRMSSSWRIPSLVFEGVDFSGL